MPTWSNTRRIALGANNLNGLKRLDRIAAPRLDLFKGWHLFPSKWKDFTGRVLDGVGAYQTAGLSSETTTIPTVKGAEIDFLVDWAWETEESPEVTWRTFNPRKRAWGNYNGRLLIPDQSDLDRLLGCDEAPDFDFTVYNLEEIS